MYPWNNGRRSKNGRSKESRFLSVAVLSYIIFFGRIIRQKNLFLARFNVTI